MMFSGVAKSAVDGHVWVLGFGNAGCGARDWLRVDIFARLNLHLTS